ncbi:DUF4412 [Desulfonema limicola]|uniref:DUF4412 n=1 Tax=Desulfonema limicola TaxID=45656 RepID=A0A975B6S9_9BACT|nr:DUF4412 domain-containing protein [Desulfonema limicola]QTA79867.1 DUF4412 [Desulfonema limicola]
MKKRIFMALGTIILSLYFISTGFAAEFAADMITEMPGGKDRGRIYFKNPDISRTELMGGLINITKRPLVYQLFTDTKKYYVNDITKDKNNNMADVRTIEEWIEKNELKKTGTEKKAGYNCTIYQGIIKYSDAQPDEYPTKIWYSKELEYPVRTETALPEPMGMIVSYLENIKPGKQPDSLFEIPSNYKKAGSIEEAAGAADINLPFLNQENTENPQQKMPSKEDMEKMMQQMQKMQKMMEQGKDQ